jgi:solute carrier family 35 protein E3
MGSAEAKKQAYDGCAWFFNVSTSVLIVFVNKVLMDPKKGYGFTFGAS